MQWPRREHLYKLALNMGGAEWIAWVATQKAWRKQAGRQADMSRSLPDAIDVRRIRAHRHWVIGRCLSVLAWRSPMGAQNIAWYPLDLGRSRTTETNIAAMVPRSARDLARIQPLP